jgi:hypothetical protein
MGWLDAWLLCGLAAVAAGFDVALPLPRFTPGEDRTAHQPTSLSGADLAVLAVLALHSS